MKGRRGQTLELTCMEQTPEEAWVGQASSSSMTPIQRRNREMAWR